MPRNLKGRSFISGTTIGVMALGAVSCATTQVGDLEGRTISEVEVVFRGYNNMAEERVRSLMRSRSGGKYSTSLVDDDIRSLYESGLVSDVKMTVNPDGEQVKVTAEVEPRPLPGPPLFVGNKAFSDVRLLKESRLRRGSDVTSEELEAECRNLEAFYLKHGYPNACVSCRSFAGGATKPEDFIFVIEEGSKVE